VRIYLDVSCLNRAFDDQTQTRIRLEAEATTIILERCELGEWQHVSSEMATIEIAAMPDAERRARVQLLLPSARSLLRIEPRAIHSSLGTRNSWLHTGGRGACCRRRGDSGRCVFEL